MIQGDERQASLKSFVKYNTRYKLCYYGIQRLNKTAGKLPVSKLPQESLLQHQKEQADLMNEHLNAPWYVVRQAQDERSDHHLPDLKVVTEVCSSLDLSKTHRVN